MSKSAVEDWEVLVAEKESLSDMKHLFGYFPSEFFSLCINTTSPLFSPSLMSSHSYINAGRQGLLPASKANWPGSSAGRSKHSLSSREPGQLCHLWSPSSACLEIFASMWTLDRGSTLHWVLCCPIKASTEEKKLWRHLLYSTNSVYLLSALGNGTLNDRWSLPKYHHQITEKTFY